ncbi:DUF6249 domain-containing protein [Anaeromyxobacter oryzae]|uniref:DUF6249 domain-containing protein n=1 Tax=Anaeromyxobacter oryzae TaxID=2918170 RepID=A0ABM7WRN0_9BACT|nr:DUF6249 domain-containing protein [Anaeromyxobacter oryzae]BDG02106.1 hypothetical protein AMOR_11020 [Anaeromyxobacter oryzae]
MIRRLAPLLAVLAPALARAGEDSKIAAELAPVLATAATFGGAALIVAIVLFARNRTAHLRHETIRLALEKGQPLPPELLAAPRREPDPTRDLRWGLILLGLGAGLGLFLFSLPDARQAAGVGLVPGLLGAGFLVTWLVTGRAGAGRAGAPGTDA